MLPLFVALAPLVRDRSPPEVAVNSVSPALNMTEPPAMFTLFESSIEVP